MLHPLAFATSIFCGLAFLSMQDTWADHSAEIAIAKDLAWMETDDGQAWRGCLMAPMLDHMRLQADICPPSRFSRLSDIRETSIHVSKTEIALSFLP